ncbi:MAG: multiubiquitin domain-containing protein [Bacteroidetes bacterium]|nr:multiubiquitin domain-containing protein [Bacteroidota bacterium]
MKKEEQKNEHGKHVLHLTINGKQYEWPQQYITGAEIRKLGNIPPVEDVFLAIKKPWEDEPIVDDTRINLARPEIEHLYSKDKHQKITLIVNGRPKPWAEKTITFEQVVILAFGSYDPNPNKVYTVTYDKGPHENPHGTMDKGDKVCVKDKMIFNVTCTDKS